jgi:hypothetical protein
MTRQATIPAGAWPARMSPAIAAGYCGEPSVESFLRRVGTEYPAPVVDRGRRKLWLKEHLDQAIQPESPVSARVADAALDL